MAVPAFFLLIAVIFIAEAETVDILAEAVVVRTKWSYFLAKAAALHFLVRSSSSKLQAEEAILSFLAAAAAAVKFLGEAASAAKQ